MAWISSGTPATRSGCVVGRAARLAGLPTRGVSSIGRVDRRRGERTRESSAEPPPKGHFRRVRDALVCTSQNSHSSIDRGSSADQLADWRSTLLTSLLSAIAVCCGVLSIAQSSAPVPADNAGPRWTAAAPAINGVSLDLVPEWARTARTFPGSPPTIPPALPETRTTTMRATTTTRPAWRWRRAHHADGRSRPHPAYRPSGIGRRLSPTSDGHSLGAPPQ